MSTGTYIVRRLGHTVFLLWIISLISFGFVYSAPGDVIAVLQDPGASHATTQLQSDFFRDYLGLNRPIYVQYWEWLKGLAHGDLGISYIDQQPVLKKILERVPATLWLTGTAMLISIIVAIPIGIYSAVKRNSFFDMLLTGYSYVGLSVPTFYIALVAILFFSLTMGWLPASGMRETFEYFDVSDRLQHLILPAFVLSFGMIAGKSRYMRSSMLEVISQDYITTARAKGLPERVVILKHALRNGLIPIITIITMQLPILLGGAFIIEQIFAWPGLGRLAINATWMRDYPIVMGTTMITAVMVILCNLLADVLYVFVDPRIKYGREQ